MRTKLSAFCDAVIEAGWLLVLIIEPLFFSVYTSRVFEPDKLSILRSIAALVAVAWIAKWIEARLGARSAPAQPPQAQPHSKWWQRPLVGPAALLAVVYLLTTITSVAPRISLWGSYQRLQGTYTTLSYLVIFFSLLANLRRREQVERVLTTAILTSLPVALYGLLQHYQIDPLPWAGNVTFRVASTLGNSIFVGAYLIMVVPVTLVRMLHVEAGTFEGASKRLSIGMGLGFALALVIEVYVWASLGFWRGLAVGLILTTGMALVGLYLKRPVARFILSGCYTLILSAQCVTIVFSQSRGPWLGLVVGLFFLGLLYVFARRWRKLAIAFVSIAVLMAAFLAALNMPNSPLAKLRDLPYVGRLGQLLEIGSGTGKVRVLIWEGAVEMLKANPLRTLIGYGPEAMYVAYNQFYPPDLAHYERRNASPDRSHNETFDTLIMTGVIGFIAYMLLFGSIFYYGLKWLGLIRGPVQKRLFWICGAVGAVLGVVLPWLFDHSLRLAGVGLPLGFMAGLGVYVAVFALIGMLRRHAEEQTDPQKKDAPLTGWPLLLLVGLIAAIAAHFVEINAGIAIAATRTYFWTFAALLAIVGQGGVLTPAPAPVASSVSAESATAGRRTTTTRRPINPGQRSQTKPGIRNSAKPAGFRFDGQLAGLLVSAGVMGWILVTLAWNYTTNPSPVETNAFGVIIRSLTTMAAKSDPDTVSLGLLLLVLGTWFVGLCLSVSELAAEEDKEHSARWWARSAGLYALVSLGVGGIYALIHAAQLTSTTINAQNLIYDYYLAGLLVLIGLGVVLFFAQARPAKPAQGFGVVGGVVVLVLALVLIINTNISIVRADVLYKQGLRYDSASSWDNAIYFYQEAIKLAPKEDYYYLFRGRALMERAKEESDTDTRDALFEAAFEALVEAKQLNPLNTDHTANMGRLYRTWAEMDSDTESQQNKLEKAAAYYAEAVQLSPHNAQLYNEWGLVYYELGDLDQAMVEYEQSLVLDQEYSDTYLLMGDVYLARQDWAAAAQVYERALALDDSTVQAWSALAYAYSQSGDLQQAISTNLQVLVYAPEDYTTLKNLAILYRETEQPLAAIDAATRALAVASDEDKAAIQNLIEQEQAKLVPSESEE